MRFRRKRRRAAQGRALEAAARVDRRTKDLLHRLKPGEIAVIDHADLDRVSAEGLVEAKARAVVNASRSASVRYPNDGPLILAKAGIPFVDAAGPDILERISEGDVIRIVGGDVYRDADLIASGERPTIEELEEAYAAAEATVGDELDLFIRNTLEYMAAERDLVLRGAGVPTITTPLAGRHALVVVRGHHYKQDLEALRGYIGEIRPAIIAVDGAADALLEEGLTPDVIVGDMDSVSTEALTSGAEIVVHAYPDGRAPGFERLEGLGVEGTLFRSAGTSQDIALLLAYEHGAEPIVTVGMQTNLVEFLDKGRGGMASTFLVRLRVGTRLVDAKGVSRLYRTQLQTRHIVLLVASALAAMLVVVWVSDPLRLFFRSIPQWINDIWFDLRQLFS